MFKSKKLITALAMVFFAMVVVSPDLGFSAENVNPDLAGGKGGGKKAPTYNKVPITGQTTSYAVGDDGNLQKGLPWPEARFTDNGDGTVTDNLTGLMWLKDANCIATHYDYFDNDETPGDGGVTWQHALDFVAGINNQTYSQCGAGYTDWRLPNVRELESLIDFGNREPCLPTDHPFTNVKIVLPNGIATSYWSSTTSISQNDYAWHVNFSR